MLEELLGSERAPLLRQARSHSRRAEDADDALSDACVQFLRYYDGPPGTDALRWMLVVTKRCAWAIARHSNARESRVVVGETGAGKDVAALVREERSGPGELLERSEESARVTELIEGLKPDERVALILLGLGYSYKEIAELRGWSVRKVNRCVTEGRASVRELMARGVKS
jgi:RNA polymerase sigma factor, sigma-70 family